jgi:glycosyltransferase involved in cell wall biosynthesis
MELETLKMADKVVVISDGMKQEFQEIFQRSYDVITNGFDIDDLPEKFPKPDKKFSIAHIGSLVKSRNPEFLWNVLKELVDQHPGFADDLEIKLVGKVDYFVTQSIEKYQLTSFVNKIDYLPHSAVIGEQLKSQVLLLLINNTPNAHSILTGKFFEYMASHRPILCIGPANGDAANIIHETNCGLISGFEDKSGLKKNVLKLYSGFKNDFQSFQTGNIEGYSRKKLTEILTVILISALPKK